MATKISKVWRSFHTRHTSYFEVLNVTDRFYFLKE